jgi:hypothetical protein
VGVRFAVKYTYKECANKEESQVCPFFNKEFLTWILSNALCTDIMTIDHFDVKFVTKLSILAEV